MWFQTRPSAILDGHDAQTVIAACEHICGALAPKVPHCVLLYPLHIEPRRTFLAEFLKGIHYSVVKKLIFLFFDLDQYVCYRVAVHLGGAQTVSKD